MWGLLHILAALASTVNLFTLVEFIKMLIFFVFGHGYISERNAMEILSSLQVVLAYRFINGDPFTL